jgi:AraC family transcriptional regulator
MANISNKLKYEYIHRINRAIDYIRSHAADNLDLGKIAKEACLSKYHFHRIFRSQTSETINEFVRRLRLEKAFQKLRLERNKSITDIALECGFSNSQSFAKAFKKSFNVSPKFFRGEYNWYNWFMMNATGDHLSSLHKKEGNPLMSNFYDADQDKLNSLINKINEQKKNMQVKVVDMPAFHVAYIRTIGYDLKKYRQASDKLLQWAYTRELINENSIFMGVPKSSLMITSKEKFILDICVTVPKGIERDELINIQDIPSGKYAVYHCEIDIHDRPEVWMRFLIEWLNTSGYQPDTRQSYQIYYNDYEKHPLKHMIIDMCLPVKPL